MAIIACPDCGKKISSHAVICSYCGFQLGEATEQDLEVFRAAIAYIVVRAFLFQNRRVQRAMQREKALRSGLGRRL